MRTRKATLGVSMALSVTLMAAACGSGGGTDTASDGGTSGDSASESSGGDAAAEVEQYLSPPEGIPIDTPLAKCPEEGKTIIVTENPQAVTRKTNDGLEKGAEILGWTVKREEVGTGPEDPAKAFDAALDQKPDAVLVSGNPSSVFRAQIERANSEKIPVLFSDNGEEPGTEGSATTITLDDFEQTGLWGKMTGAYAVSEGAKHVLVVDLSLYPILTAYSEAAVEQIETLSGGDTKATLIDTPVADLVAGKIPANIVSEIQRNPDIDWVLLSLGDMATGLEAALRGAGLAEKVKIGGQSASTANVTALKEGREHGYSGFAAEIHGMYRIDALARLFNGEDLGPTNEAKLPTQLLTPDNIADAPLDDEGYYVGVPEFEQHFEEIWKANC